MKFPVAIVFGLILFSIVSHEVEGRNPKLRSIDEDLEPETQLKILNKPPIKSFKDENDEDIIDCIDIYKQPAFDHPLLKNHELQMRPSSLPKGVKLGGKYSSKLTTKRKFPGCPSGTVPFRRTKKEDLIRAKAALDLIRPRSINLTSTLPPHMHYAAVTTPGKDPSQKFYGAQTYLSAYNLTSVVGNQISEAMLWLGTAIDGPYNSIEYGWTVNPQLYGDSQTRTYSLWTADGLQKSGCYNALCPGYVQVSQHLIMGEVVNPVSVFGKSVNAMEFTLFKDPKTSNWWLYTNTKKNMTPVGYWPKELFPSMSDAAKVAQLRGKVYNPQELGEVNENVGMGSGSFVANDLTRTCVAAHIQFVNSGNQFYLPKDVPMKVIADVPQTYKAVYMGDISKQHPGLEYTLMFGGPDIRI